MSVRTRTALWAVLATLAIAFGAVRLRDALRSPVPQPGPVNAGADPTSPADEGQLPPPGRRP